jgi:probable F420-dependent oxidoreductase
LANVDEGSGVSGPGVGVQVWAAGAAALAARGRQVEELGFDAVSVPDHLVGRLGAPLISCAILAQATNRVRVQTWVLNNDLRHPAVLAREAAALAELSGGRFELGLGAGHAKVEYDRAGIPFAPGPVRVARMWEAVQVLRRLLAGEEVTFEGEHYRLAGEKVDPVPAERVRILLGGNSRAVHACAAQHADVLGLVGFGPRGPDAEVVIGHFSRAAFERQLARLGELGAGRAEPLGLQVLVQHYEITDERDAVLERLAAEYELSAEELSGSPYVAVGTEEEVAAQWLDLHRRDGIGQVTVFADKPDAPPVETLVPVLERLAGAG